MKTYGTIDHFKGAWVLTCEPHVVMRLKRIFPRIARSQDFIGIADTLEVARDLEWFLSRHPLEFKSPEVEARLAERASKHREGVALVDKLMSGTMPAMAFRLALPAREYQKLAASLVLATGGILVADQVGLGKTASAICVLTDPRTRPALVVTLTHLPKQWEAECRKFAPRLTTHILQGTRPYDLTKQCGGKMPDVILTSYSKLAGWGEVLGKKGLLRSVTYDEVQELRHGVDTEKGTAAAMISRAVQFRCGLSATPIFGYGGEIWNVIEAIRPGALGTRQEFAREWGVGDTEAKGKLKIKEPIAFGSYLRDAGLMIRRTRAEVGRQIPKITRVVQHVDCDLNELASIESAATKLAHIIMSKSEQSRGENFRARAELSSLVRRATGCAKAPYVAEFVKMLVDNGEKVLLFGWHYEFYGIINERLKDLKPAFFTGAETQKQKAEAKERFIENDTDVLVMSLRAGAGIDGLQFHCCTNVFGELDYSPAVTDQDEGRLARDGQSNPTASYFLVTDTGSDPIIADILGLKKAQSEGILNPTGETIDNLIPEADGQHIKRLAQAYLANHGAKARA